MLLFTGDHNQKTGSLRFRGSKMKNCAIFFSSLSIGRFVVFFAALLLIFTAVSPVQLSAQQALTEEKNTAVQQNPAQKNADPLGGSLYSYEEPKIEKVSYAWLLFKTLFVLALFAVGVYFTVRFLSKRGGFQPLGKSVISTLSVLPVGQNRQLQVVECGSRLLVIGVTDSQISLLREITDKDEIDRMKLQASRSLTAAADSSVKYFTDHFEGVVRSLGSVIGNVIDKSRKAPSNSISVQEFEAAPAAEEFAQVNDAVIEGAAKKDRYSFFDDEKIDYLQKQKSRLKYMNRFGNEQ